MDPRTSNARTSARRAATSSTGTVRPTSRCRIAARRACRRRPPVRRRPRSSHPSTVVPPPPPDPTAATRAWPPPPPATRPRPSPPAGRTRTSGSGRGRAGASRSRSSGTSPSRSRRGSSRRGRSEAAAGRRSRSGPSPPPKSRRRPQPQPRNAPDAAAAAEEERARAEAAKAERIRKLVAPSAAVPPSSPPAEQSAGTDARPPAGAAGPRADGAGATTRRGSVGRVARHRDHDRRAQWAHRPVVATARQPGAAPPHRRDRRRRRRVQEGEVEPPQRARQRRRVPVGPGVRHRRPDRGGPRRRARRSPSRRCRTATDARRRARAARRRWPARSATSTTTAAIARVEVGLPRRLLATGLTFVDTPGVGGLDSALGALVLARLDVADGVLFVTDCSQELTAPELAYLTAARRALRIGRLRDDQARPLPERRRARRRNRGHLDAAGLDDVEIVAVSSVLHLLALAESDPAARGRVAVRRALRRPPPPHLGTGPPARARRRRAPDGQRRRPPDDPARGRARGGQIRRGGQPHDRPADRDAGPRPPVPLRRGAMAAAPRRGDAGGDRRSRPRPAHPDARRRPDGRGPGRQRRRPAGRRPRLRGVAAQGGDGGRHRPLRVDHRAGRGARRRGRPAVRRLRPRRRVPGRGRRARRTPRRHPRRARDAAR